MLRRLALTMIAVTGLVACSDGGDTATEPTRPVTPSTVLAPVASTVAATASPPSAAASSPSPPSETPPSAEPPSVPVAVTDPPQTGVPGVAATDPLCAAYGTLLSTEYLLGLVEAFGDEPGARRAEATAASTVLAAVDAAAAALGSDASTSGLAERWKALTDRARTAAGSGLDPVATATVWATVLADHDRNDPSLVLALDPALAAPVDTAAVALESVHGPLAADETYLAAVSEATPSIDSRLTVSCPEVAALQSGDAV